MEIKNPKFSIIIPVYNVEKYLNQCLDSVFAQTFTDFEVICVNDGSTDGSLKILEEYKAKYLNLVVISQQNSGAAGARNTGIKIAKGKYICFFDSDDWIEHHCLKVLSDNENNEDLICFNGKRVFENGYDETPDEGYSIDKISGWDYYNKFVFLHRKFHFVCPVLRIYKKDFLTSNNIFFEKGICHEDDLFAPIVCYYAQEVKVIPDSLYFYRIREGSVINTANFKLLTDIIVVANKLSSFFILKQNLKKDILYRAIAHNFFSVYSSRYTNYFGNKDHEFKALIDWNSFREVCIYPRHKVLFKLLKLSPSFYRLFTNTESLIKRLIKG